jgi:hypothetical protein
MLGGKSGYFVWEPMFSELEGSGLEEVDKGDGLLYGPVGSWMIIDELSLTLSLLTGKQTKYFSERNKYKTFGGSSSTYTGTYNVEFKRTDIDTALSYSLMKGLKLIVGYKYQIIEMDYDATYVDIDNNRVTYFWETMEFPAHGPAIGVGYSYAFSDTYFAAVNFTIVYMWGKWKFVSFEEDQYTPDGSGNLQYNYSSMDPGSFKTTQYGMNFEPVVGAKVLDDMIVTLGFRFQWMRTDFVDGFAPGGNEMTPDKPLNDYIYGMFVSAIYMF